MKNRSSVSSARVRSANCPIWSPITVNMQSSSRSASCRSLVKNSTTAITSEPDFTGNASPDCRPSRAAIGARGKLLSVCASGIHCGCPLAQASPGSPIPGANVRRLVTSSNSLGVADCGLQVAMHRSTFQRGSTFQTAPSCHPNASPIPRSSRGAASAREVEETSTLAAASRAASCRLACMCSAAAHSNSAILS